MVRQLVANIHSLLSTLSLKEDIWSVGPTARVSPTQREMEDISRDLIFDDFVTILTKGSIIG